MPTWNEINQEIDGIASNDACDKVRTKYLAQLSARLDQPVVAYYSGYLQKRQPNGSVHLEATITDNDMNGLMATVHGVDRTKGLSLILHTPGGDIEAGRGFVEYLYKMFGRSIHVIVPQIAMSAGTMIACAANTIAMGKHSCLGPTDPQVNGIAAMGVLEEVDRAIQEIKQEPAKQIIWQQVFAKYPPAFIRNCERAIDATRTMVNDWLQAGMLSSATDPAKAASEAVKQLMDYGGTSAHHHHFLTDKCQQIGLNIIEIETDQDFQEDVLSVHHSFMASFSRMSAIKIIHNSNGGIWAVNT